MHNRRIYHGFNGFRLFVKKDFSKAMSFGSRLAEERKRLGLRQAEFADLVGTDVPKQSLYENDRRDLRADYLARLAEAEVDVLYVLTGERSTGQWLSSEASELLSACLALRPEVRTALLAFVKTVGGREQSAFTAPTLHAPSPGYRAGTPREG
ncbi:helix-turn-helix transcriptional regulator [Allosphingosinicella flava]|uniref:Helix-turn-helix transcriptional regulator n=1 Tax=Allosphingosinicella flava TaxID=2771430 RepID=A0A7T2LMT7_9SPHN|nr:helix-turn-helix transcriptional regulator [Sphingosinicella flava]QPQ55628.1 helix-turn-helix transcriptional regulator [Sphingosinicella flava]